MKFTQASIRLYQSMRDQRELRHEIAAADPCEHVLAGAEFACYYSNDDYPQDDWCIACKLRWGLQRQYRRLRELTAASRRVFMAAGERES